MEEQKHLILKARIRVDEKPNSSSKIWQLCESYPCELEFSHMVRWVHGKSQITVTNPLSGKQWTDTASRVANVLSTVNYDVVE